MTSLCPSISNHVNFQDFIIFIFYKISCHTEHLFLKPFFELFHFSSFRNQMVLRFRQLFLLRRRRLHRNGDFLTNMEDYWRWRILGDRGRFLSTRRNLWRWKIWRWRILSVRKILGDRRLLGDWRFLRR